MAGAIIFETGMKGDRIALIRHTAMFPEYRRRDVAEALKNEARVRPREMEFTRVRAALEYSNTLFPKMSLKLGHRNVSVVV